jgi:hypothetical protein
LLGNSDGMAVDGLIPVFVSMEVTFARVVVPVLVLLPEAEAELELEPVAFPLGLAPPTVVSS